MSQVTVEISPDAIVTELAVQAGAQVARAGTPEDAVDSVVPMAVVEPTTAEAVARVVGWASQAGRSLVVRGGGTKLSWGASPTSVDVLLRTTGLHAVEAHRHGDLTATVQAGATLAQTNAVLAAHHQWLPLDPPGGAEATIGGIVATNDSGPRRQHHGVPRDLIIGMTLARADGVISRSGGIVVKNVAGYDLARLLTGSFGCLGVILNATFKLAPLAEASRTVAVEFPASDRFSAFAAALVDRASTPSALELAFPPATMLVRFESVESVAVAQAEEAMSLARAHGGTPTVLIGHDESAVWQKHEARIFAEDGTVLRLSVLPSELTSTLAWLDETATAQQLDYVVAGRAGLTALSVRLNGEIASQVKLIRELRERFPSGRGSAVIRRAEPALTSHVDVWGPVGDALPMMQAVKQQFDPVGILNPGRGPGAL